VQPSRRKFLKDLATSAGAIAAARRASPAALVHAHAARQSGAPGSAAQPSFRGGRPGEERVVDGTGFCWCPPGRFVMGSPPTERGHRPDEAQVDVTLTRGFWTAKHEVTQGQWREVMGAFPDRPPSRPFGEGDDFPIYWVNFEEAAAFCAELTRRLRRSGALPAGWEVGLPTEAQWEYACRAGTATATSFGDTLGQDRANIGVESADRSVRARGGARRVGSYPASPWGIHDMHGNVWEWCRDYYHARLPGGTDPDLYASKGVANRDGTHSRVRRGGAWIEEPWACRSACRLRYEPHRRSDHIGFRILAVER
jgi:formylglycine-generating enzyme required for sulfatase activity